MSVQPSPADFMERSTAFRSRISDARKSLEPQPFPWYAYDILANVDFTNRLLQEAKLTLADLTGDRPVLDIGCADGDLAFFLEEQGCAVTAIDYPSTNANGMQAVRALRGALGSSIEILEADIDQGFVPPQGANYSLAVLLGILYHLKNPYMVLESLAKYANYCLLSTRVTRHASAGGTSLEGLPVAYLLHPGETNNDVTNYWIFSNAGLKRLIRRTGWDICAYFNVGNTEASDPVTAGGDERAFCLLQRASAFTNGVLRDGWYDSTVSRDGWRWTGDSFTVEFPVSGTEGPGEIELQVYLGAAQVGVTGSVTLTASANGVPLTPHIFTEPGSHLVRLPVSAGPNSSGNLRVQFHVTPPAPAAPDPRVLGLIVNSIKMLGTL